MESIAISVQDADDIDLLVLVLPGFLLVIELVSRIVSRFEDELFAFPHDDAFNALLRRLWLGLADCGCGKVEEGSGKKGSGFS